MKKYILFDLDGTLLNSMPYHAKAWLEVFSQYGLDFKEEDIYLNEGALEFEVVRKMFKNKGLEITKQQFEELFKLQKSIFKEKYSRKVKPFPEVPELLLELKRQGKELALVTSSHQEVFEEVFPGSLTGFFSLILTGDKTQRRKPHPEPYLKALEGLSAKKEDTLVVENAPAGILSAKSAQLFCIGITTTLPKDKLSLADLIVHNHSELKEVLLNGKREV
jgi:HAD superfamily hydrolase (TIGR01509 family)